MSDGSATRAAAATAVAAVLTGKSLEQCLGPLQSGFKKSSDRAFVQTLTLGTLRHLGPLRWLLTQLLERPLKSRDSKLEALLLVGLHQLRDMDIPAHAAVSACVDATRHIGHARGKGLTNAILRRYLREQDDMESRLPDTAEIKYSHPQWLIDQIKTDWPEQWQDIFCANQQQPPLTLRINRCKISRQDYCGLLDQAGLSNSCHAQAADAVIVRQAGSVKQLPGFDEGYFSVQDASAQLGVDLVDIKSDSRILDACAAPGGKTTHLLERFDGLDLLALDASEQRLSRLRENLTRLQLSCNIKAADATDPQAWWDNQPFDHILLDAPCTGTGVIRRHPDIKWLRRRSDLEKLQNSQTRLLNALWPTLKPGGTLLYVTCSILKVEGSDVTTQFICDQADASEIKLPVTWGQACETGRIILPGESDMDGFYFCLLKKCTNLK